MHDEPQRLSMSKILIRADGGKKIGLGHWSRCLFLVSCIDKPAEVILFTHQAVDFKEVFPSSRVSVQQINQEQDFIDTVVSGDLVILDDYKIDQEYVRQLAQKGALIVYIDDLFKENIPADIIINHCPGNNPLQFKNTSAFTSYLLGADFSLIAEDFSKSNVASDKRLQQALVCMGGADPHNHTISVLSDFEELFQHVECVNVVVGSMYVYRSELEKIVNRQANIKIYDNLNRSEVSNLMKQSGLAILSASTMALEYAHVGGVLTIKQTADNQKHLYKGLLSEHVAVDTSTLTINLDKFQSLYQDLKAKQAQLFDGKSKSRFQKLFKELEIQQHLMLNKVTQQDVDITFKWATDKKIRAFSFTQSEITYKEHAAWFEKKISATDCLYFIATLENKPVGSIRFDIVESTATISYLVDAAYHGIGLGRSLLAEGMKKLLKHAPGTKKIVGFVLPTNTPSVRVFEKLGFQRDSTNTTDSIKFYKDIEA